MSWQGGGPRVSPGGPAFLLCIRFSRGSVWELLEARKAAVGLSILARGASAGSAVLGEKAVSFSDPDPHRHMAQQNPGDEQVLLGLVEPSMGWGSSPQF